jgi:deoxyguanosine kinase
MDMSEKSRKLPSIMRTIAVEGVLGAGKTELCTFLAEQCNSCLVLDGVDENPFLPKFYKNRSLHAFQTQLWFLLSRYKQLSDTLLQQDLFRDGVVIDYLFAKDRIFAAINLDENEFSLYNAIARILDKDVPRPDYVVYLQASTETLLKRIEKRGRPFEFNMDFHYIDAINRAYNHFFFHYTASPLLIINTNAIDFVNNEKEREEVIDQILAGKPGSNYYQPLGSAEYSKILKKTKDRGERSREGTGDGGATWDVSP